MEYTVIKKIPDRFSEKGIYVDKLSPYQFIVKYVKDGGVYTKKAIFNIQDLKKLDTKDESIYITERAENLLTERLKNRAPTIKSHASQRENGTTFDMFDTGEIFDARKDVLINKVAVMNLQGWT